MPGDLTAVRLRARQYLEDRFGAVRVNADGDVSLRQESDKVVCDLQSHFVGTAFSAD
ncbi:hypothetical protein [Mycobacterium sp. C31M]